jgi:hypothetical protein
MPGRIHRGLVVVGALLSGAAANAQTYAVDPEAGRNTFSAVFEAPLGERINAVSSAVSCKLTLEGTAAAGKCSVGLTTIKVDSEPTKTEHFQQWSTNKKVAPEKCRYEAALQGVSLAAPLAAGQKIPFEGQAKFAVCGRPREDGGTEKITGTAAQMPDGTLRIRAEIKGFNRESYGISPKNTAGWLARVQQLAPVVNATGDIEINVFASRESK